MDGLEKIEEGAGRGTIKFSFRNLLALHSPLVIVDEAHNSTSPLSVEVMQKNPARLHYRIYSHARRQQQYPAQRLGFRTLSPRK
ncbi:MAG: hypothetical protein MZV63_72110 [Marinilabiliales bacterium]|nr:hypothetical protein [Marinilabiliales bacterium]